MIKSIVMAGMMSISLLGTPVHGTDTNSTAETKKTTRMNEYLLIIRLPLNYGAEQAKAVREQWNEVLQKWKTDSVFVTSFVAPNEGYVISGTERTTRKETVVCGNLRVVTTMVIRASGLEEAVELAKVCPVLPQGGTVEVKEVQPRPATPGQK